MKWIPLFVTNFVGVLNDNLLKNLISFIAIAWIAKEHDSLVITGATACLVLPYVLFSPLAGFFTKRNSKAKILRILQLVEIPIMVIAVIGFFLKSVPTVLFSMFLMGIQSCMYSPAKYGLIRDIGGKQGISFGTGSMEMLTFLGVLLGAFLGGSTSDIDSELWGMPMKNIVLAALLLGLALIGWIASLTVRPKEETPDRESSNIINPILFVLSQFKKGRQYPGLNMVVAGLGMFWLIGSLLQMNVILHCPGTYGLSNTQTSMIMALIAIGIGAGCGLAGILSKKEVAVQFIPYAGTAMAVFNAIIFFVTPPVEIFTMLIVATAFAAGFYKVPLNSWIQENVHGPELGVMIAYNNLITFLFILVSAAIFPIVEINFGTNAIFIVVSIMAVASTITLSKTVVKNHKQAAKL